MKYQNDVKLATWNICLGLANKKDLVSNTILENGIDICVMQEIDIAPGYDSNLLTFNGYNLLTENSNDKQRLGMYIKNGVDYSRKDELEGLGNGLIIVDVKLHTTIRIIGLYRIFNPPGNVTQRGYFTAQLQLVKNAAEQRGDKKLVLLGDFNLNEAMKFNNDYSHKSYYDELNTIFDRLGLIQMVEFETWRRSVNGIMRTSILDHVYTNDVTVIENLKPVDTIIGDHSLITMSLLNEKMPKPDISFRRDWSKYSKVKLVYELSMINMMWQINDVQGLWNKIEEILIRTTDKLAPLSEHLDNVSAKSQEIPKIIKRKMRKRKDLLRKMKEDPSEELRKRVKNLNIEIKNHFTMNKRHRVRKGIVPGNSRSLWKAVSIAKDINSNEIPKEMFIEGNRVCVDEVAESFATHFEDKISRLTSEIRIDQNVFNGTRTILDHEAENNFMTIENIRKAVLSIKLKNSEGEDRIPQRILIDGMEILLQPLAVFFSMVYRDKVIPEQWKMAKITPVHKKGPRKEVKNYRPVANLCSGSKIYEKLILHRIQEIQDEENVDITNENQHGFKRGKSTTTAGLAIQSALARALDLGEFALLANLDLSSAFDVVNVDLLLKRMRIVGLPRDVIELVAVWLKGRMFYVSVNGRNSFIRMSDIGTVQGSILGPFLYALFVSPLFELTTLTAFADDKQIMDSNRNLELLIMNMERKLEMITKWLRDSGLVVNEEKTEICLFHRADHEAVEIVINDQRIKSKKTINVLGVLFDSKLQWTNQVSQAIHKSKRALHGIKLIKKYLTKNETKMLMTSNFYSVLYYNCEIWLSPDLSGRNKQQILAASANALKLLNNFSDLRTSYVQLHCQENRAVPMNFSKYRLAIQLYKIYNNDYFNDDWQDMNAQQNFNARMEMFQINDFSRLKVGKNILCNRLTVLNNQIQLNWLNLSLTSFKLKVKSIFLTN